MKMEEKNNETKRRRSERINYLPKCLHSSKYVIDHANVRFFFLIFLRICSHSSNNVNTLHYFAFFHLRSFRTYELFEHMIFLKIIRFTKKSKNIQSQGVHFWSIWRHKFEKLIWSTPTMIAPSLVLFMDSSAQESSG